MDPVVSVRRFNRLYTRQIGLLNEGLLRSPFSLSEVRVLYEIVHGDRPTAASLADALRIDPGYLSRMLRRFESLGLLRRSRSRTDGRQRLLSLTSKGRRTFSTLDGRQDREVAALLGPLSPGDRGDLVRSMAQIERILAPQTAPGAAPYLLRPPRPGDLGWVVHRHGVLYAEEQGYDERFEAFVARIVADFVMRHEPARERCWIAEKDGEIVGSVLLARESARVAKLRILYVEPHARGLGIGCRLVDECIRFARLTRYRRITLYTHGQLHAARRIYEAAGFRLVAESPDRSYGRAVKSQTWELAL